MPHENFGGLTVGRLDTYFQLYFLRCFNGFDVFIKNHGPKADIHTFILFKLWLMECFFPVSKELTIILKKMVLNTSMLLTVSRGKVFKLVPTGLWFSLLWWLDQGCNFESFPAFCCLFVCPGRSYACNPWKAGEMLRMAVLCSRPQRCLWCELGNWKCSSTVVLTGHS